jgi:hypothetical protein
MLNKEKYKDKIEEIFSYTIGVSKSGEMCRCKDMGGCYKCIFHGGNCVDNARDWLNSECKESVLTDEEREYLSAVIKPFRRFVRCIKKLEAVANGMEKISLYSQDSQSWGCTTILPPFKKSTGMFQNMELGREYTLEELGL